MDAITPQRPSALEIAKTHLEKAERLIHDAKACSDQTEQKRLISEAQDALRKAMDRLHPRGSRHVKDLIIPDSALPEIVENYRTDPNASRIARELGISVVTVLGALRRANVPINHDPSRRTLITVRSIPDNLCEEITRLYCDEDRSADDICLKYGVNARTIIAALRRWGVIIRPHGTRTGRKRSVTH